MHALLCGESFPDAQLMSRVDCDGVASCDCSQWCLNCGVMVLGCCGGVVVNWLFLAVSSDRPNPSTVTYLYLPRLTGVLTPRACIWWVCSLLACLPGPGWPGIFSLRAVVISSNDLMIINSGLFFLTWHLAITPLAVFLSCYCWRWQRKRRRRKERRLLVLGINFLVSFYIFL
jgi:hypothetical protein